MVVIGVLRHVMSAEAFADWGWRVPFLLSFILLGVSVYIRLKLQESPIFAEMKAQGKGSKPRSGTASRAGTTDGWS